MSFPHTFKWFVIDSQSEWTKFRQAEVSWSSPGEIIWESSVTTRSSRRNLKIGDDDISVEACDVCGSDAHKMSMVAVGDRVRAGTQVSACLECKNYKSDNENYCPH